MWDFQQEKKFTDLVIHIGSDTYECHKLVLASVPGYFRDLFCLDFEESVREEITIRAPNPSGVFSDVLRYLYLSDLSVVTAENALFLYLQAVYFRLPELKRAAETVFDRIDIHGVIEVLKQASGLRPPFVPPKLVEFLARSFHQYSTMPVFSDLPPGLVHDVLRHGALRIASDRQLIDFLSALNAKEPLSSERRREYAGLVQWKFLSDEDWAAVNWQILIDKKKKERFVAIRRQKKLGISGQATNVFLALDAPDPRAGVAILRRYYPPMIQEFTFGENFMSNPAKWHVNTKLMDVTRPDVVVAMLGNAGLYLWELRAVVAMRRNVDLLTILSVPLGGGKPNQKAFLPENVDGKAVFNAKMDDRVPASRLTLVFTVQDVKKFSIVSLAAEGFVFLG
jgi:hypothetical protein